MHVRYSKECGSYFTEFPFSPEHKEIDSIRRMTAPQCSVNVLSPCLTGTQSFHALPTNLTKRRLNKVTRKAAPGNI